MIADERRHVILEHVRANGAVALKELARVVGTSEVTVRRDLRLLEAQGLLGRRHGGAVANGALNHEPTYSEKSHQAADEKSAIADLAVELVAEGDAIAIGAGTTTQAFAQRLTRFSDLTVMTNSLLVAQALARSRGVDVVMTGGLLRGSIFALVGSGAEQTLAGMRTAKVFLSGNGLTASRGLSTPNLSVAGVDRAMVGGAQEVVVLADHTKIGAETMVQTVPPGEITHLVTDDRAPSEELVELRRLGVAVHVATPASRAPAEDAPDAGEDQS
ncbi:MAG: DeoR/GlpR family DNA-binding transcription regulator [Actinomycetota bacterium]|nr:DeoR/GlpR family DNA-binding transcription regulator [Actinomycetota bacterium]